MSIHDTNARRSGEDPELLKAALNEYTYDGVVSTVACDQCGSLIEVFEVNSCIIAYRCNCGRYNGSLADV